MFWTAAGELKEGMDTLDAGVADAIHGVVAAGAEAWDDVASAARDVADATNSVAAATNSAAVEGQAVSVCPTQMSLASERVAAEIVACSDKEEDEEAFWSDLSFSQSEAQHAESQRAAQKQRADDSAIAVVDLAGVTKGSDAQGSSRREKNRLTLILRQSLHGVFDPTVEVPEGRIRDEVLSTHSAKHARLEDMSYAEPS